MDDEIEEYEIVEKREENSRGKVYEYGTYQEVGKRSFSGTLLFWAGVAASIVVGAFLFFFLLTVFLYVFLPVFLFLVLWGAIRAIFRR